MPEPDPLQQDRARWLYNPLAAQYALQVETYNIDPISLTPDERAEFFRWNFVAMISELVETGDEIGWKPWATSRHLNTDEYVGELVDAFHFFLNLLLVTGVTWETFIDRYLEKRRINADRQVKGYDGVSGKCPHCHRDVATTSHMHNVVGWVHSNPSVLVHECRETGKTFNMETPEVDAVTLQDAAAGVTVSVPLAPPEISPRNCQCNMCRRYRGEL